MTRTLLIATTRGDNLSISITEEAVTDDRPFRVDVRSERGIATGRAKTEAEAHALAAELVQELRQRPAEPVRQPAGWTTRDPAMVAGGGGVAGPGQPGNAGQAPAAEPVGVEAA